MSTEAEYRYWGAFDVIKSDGNNLPPAPEGWHLHVAFSGVAFYITNDKVGTAHTVLVGDYIELDPYGCFNLHIPEAVFDRYFTMREV